MIVYFGILGPLRVLRDGEPVSVGGPKQRALLSLLLLRANRFVPADWLVDALWDGRPPASARVTLRTYVAGLRRALEPGRDHRAQGDLVRGHTGGYELRVPPDALDAVRFTHLVDTAAATRDPAAAERHYADALALWRGDPLADVADLAAARPDVVRLTEARLAAAEGRFTAAVAAGRHDAVLPALRRHVAAHPQREGARAQLMLALYHSGRQAEALAVYAEGRRVLADEYGVDPGPLLRDTHRRILDHAVEPRPGLVGRATELARLADLLDAAGRTGGRAVAIVGEAGIGKTSLAAAVGERAAARGVPVVWGRCPDVGQAPPFWLWTQIVRALLDTEPGGALAGFTENPAGDPDPAARFHTYEAVSALVRTAAATNGLVLVLDDLHAADLDSLLLLRYLATTLHTGRALVVATLRPYDHDPALVATVADLARGPGFTQLRPAGLDPGATADLVRRHTGSTPPAELVERLVTRTGGNPFFITELLAAGGDLPPSVRDAVRLRLDALPASTRGSLDLLAVAGRELDTRLLDDLDPAHTAHLVTEAGPGVVRFRHPLFAEVAHAALTPSRRAALHLRLAEAGGLTPGEVAHHYGRAGRAEEHLRWTLRAADDATRRLAYEDALAHLDRAAHGLAADPDTELEVQLHRTSLLQITEGIGSDAVARVGARARELLALVGQDTDVRPALWTLGELACNRAEFTIAADLAGRLTAADGLLGAAGDYLLGVVAYFTGRLADADAHLSAAVDRLREVGPGRRTGRTPTLAPHNFRALVRSLRGAPAAARADIAAARALAEHTADPHGEANAALFAAWAALQEHDTGAALVAARRCRDVGAEGNMPHFVTTGDFLAEWAAVRAGDTGRLDAMRAAGDAIYRPGLRSTRTITIAAMADAYLIGGDPGTAAALADAGLAAAEEVGERVLTAELYRVRGRALGDADDLRTGARLAADQGAGLLAARF